MGLAKVSDRPLSVKKLLLAFFVFNLPRVGGRKGKKPSYISNEESRSKGRSPDCSLELSSADPPNPRVKAPGSSRDPAAPEWGRVLKGGLGSGKTTERQKFDFGIVLSAVFV